MYNISKLQKTQQQGQRMKRAVRLLEKWDRIRINDNYFLTNTYLT
jgi:hypothetical protein